MSDERPTVALRPATPSDAPQVAAVHVRSWQAGYADLLPDEFLRQLDSGEWAKRYSFDADDPLTTVAVTGTGTICGFVTTSIQGRTGHLMALYVEPGRWRNGVGHALMESATALFRNARIQHAELWVMAGNDRAQRFYRAHGWQPDGGRKRETVHGANVEELRFVWRRRAD